MCLPMDICSHTKICHPCIDLPAHRVNGVVTPFYVKTLKVWKKVYKIQLYILLKYNVPISDDTSVDFVTLGGVLSSSSLAG